MAKRRLTQGLSDSDREVICRFLQGCMAYAESGRDRCAEMQKINPARWIQRNREYFDHVLRGFRWALSTVDKGYRNASKLTGTGDSRSREWQSGHVPSWGGWPNTVVARGNGPQPVDTIGSTTVVESAEGGGGE